nr:MAG TPA: minor tail protein [Caudoviricetes sp.]
MKKVGETGKTAMDDVAKGADKAGSAYEKFNSKSKRVSNDFQQQQNKLKLLKQKYVELYSTLGAGAEETQKTGKEIEELSEKVDHNRKALEEAKAAADAYDKSLEGLGSPAEGTKQSLTGLGGTLDELIPKFSKIMMIKKAAQAVFEFGKESLEAAATAETAFAKVSTLLSAGTDTQAYFDSIRKESQRTGVAVADYAEAVYNALSASVDQASAVEFTATAVKLAKGGFTDTATAVDVLTTALNAYKLPASQATAISDKLITTQNLGKVTVGELAQNMGRSIPTANAYNVSIDTLCAAYAVMTKNGNQAAESTTLINAMLNELGKSGTKAANIIEERTGQSFAQLMASGVSLTDVLSILQTEANRAGLAINDLFGSAEGAKGANILVSNMEDVISAEREMGNTGATEIAYSKMMDTMAEKTNKLKNNWELLKEAVGSAFAPAAGGFVDWLNSGFDVLFGNNPFKGEAESYEEATAKAEEYRQAIQDIYDKYETGEEISNADWLRINNMSAAIKSYEQQAQEFIDGTSKVAEAAADPAERFQEATDQYVSSAEALMEAYQATYEQVLGNVQKWFGPFEKATTTVTTSLSEITSNMQSQIDFNTKYADNLQYLADNGLGSLSESLQSYGKDGAAYAATIAEALEQAGGATTEQGQAIVQQFETLMTGIEESQSGLAENFTNMSGEFASQAEQIAQDYADMIDGLDKADEAGKAAQSTMDSFVSGLENGQSAAAEVCGKLAETMMSALQGKLGTVTIGVKLVSGGANANGMVTFGPQMAIGTDYVPYNGMPAVLHRGEAILNAHEADQWRRGRSGGNGQGVTIVQNIQSVPQTPVQLAAATAAYFEQARWL